ncbi:HIRA-interacting protein 5, putative [Trypanosoma equiperdum]|uniref:HIRA-interacting protein 5, putative n=1 Tax=Trypanosoma equiperdum TaxID=5694 RepID=A0A1G4ICN8_TRYEQ|nr:HIRA-interacting protein 5, putative [Trypanosoma equiperdum]
MRVGSWLFYRAGPFYVARCPRIAQELTRGCLTPKAHVDSKRSFFVSFRETPNEACYKFFVKGVEFLPQSGNTLRFDFDNCHQSPLAKHILHNLPMVEEVTIGRDFVTVRRVDDDDTAAAVRQYAVRLGGNPTATPEETAERSAALQRKVMDAMEENCEQVKTLSGRNDPNESVDGGGENTEDNLGSQGGVALDSVDEAALRDLVRSTHWSELKLHVSALLTDHLYSGRAHIDADAPHPHPDTIPQDGDSEVVVVLKELISTTIRPQLQADGGDIRFVGLADSVMLVEMLGACRKCRSSKTTLRDMIERTTRHWVPEVQKVEEVERGGSHERQRQGKD